MRAGITETGRQLENLVKNDGMDGEVFRKCFQGKVVNMGQATMTPLSGTLGGQVFGARTKPFKIEEASDILWLSVHLIRMRIQAKPTFCAAS